MGCGWLNVAVKKCVRNDYKLLELFIFASSNNILFFGKIISPTHVHIDELLMVSAPIWMVGSHGISHTIQRKQAKILQDLETTMPSPWRYVAGFESRYKWPWMVCHKFHISSQDMGKVSHA